MRPACNLILNRAPVEAIMRQLSLAPRAQTRSHQDASMKPKRHFAFTIDIWNDCRR
jgi:hypothetical protein